MTQDPAKLEVVDWSVVRDGDTIVAEGETLTWLIQQLIHWPTRQDPDRTTNMSFLMASAARTLSHLSHPSSATSARAEASLPTRDEIVRAMYDAWPHTVTSAAIGEASGLPHGAILSFEQAKAIGASFPGLERWADGVLSLLIGTTPAPSQTAIEAITEMLRLDPACSGRVTVDTIERLAAMIQPTPASGGAGINSAVDSAHQILNLDQVEIQKAPGHVQSLAREIVAALSTTQQAEPAPLAGEGVGMVEALNLAHAMLKKAAGSHVCPSGKTGAVVPFSIAKATLAAAIAALSPHKDPGDAGQASTPPLQEAVRTYLSKSGVPETEFNADFVVKMISAMAVSYHKYGAVADAYPVKFDATSDVRARMAKYRETGNKHYLVDAANFAMIEAMHPGRKGGSEWGGNDADDSPGRTTASGHRLVQETNDGTRITMQDRAAQPDTAPAGEGEGA